MSNDQPKMECLTNIPARVTIVNKFTEGTNKHGQWFGYNVIHEGQQKTFFASPYVHEKIQQVTGGRSDVELVLLKKEEKPDDGGKKKVVWDVSLANPTQQAPPSQPAPTPQPAQPSHASAPPVPPLDPYEMLRKERKNQLWMSLRDAAEVGKKFNDDPAVNCGFQLNKDDVRAIAVHFSINAERNGVKINGNGGHRP